MLSDADVQRIIAHMNDDHADALRRYARVYGGIDGVQEATMTDLDPESMTLRVLQESGERTISISLTSPISTADQARQVLVDMAMKARDADE